MADGKERPVAKGLDRVVENALGPASKKFGTEIVPTGKEAGQVANRLAHELLRTVSGMVWGYKQIQDWIEAKVASKLEGIPEEELTEPDPRVAGPAIEAMRFASKAEEIQEMFAQLIASDMTKELKSFVHPSFVEVVKQMSTIDSNVFAVLAQSAGELKYTVRAFKNKNENSFTSHTILVSFGTTPQLSLDEILTSINSLDRLGLIEIADRYPVTQRHTDSVEKLKQMPVYLELQRAHQDLGRLDDHQEGIYVTRLGKAFARVCISKKS